MNKCIDCGSKTNLFGYKYRRIHNGVYFDQGIIDYRCGKCLPEHIKKHKEANYWEVIVVVMPNKPLEVKMRTI